MGRTPPCGTIGRMLLSYVSPWSLSWLALATALLHVGAEYSGHRTLTYVAKPATTTLILLLALRAPMPVAAEYQWAVIIGLIFALAGDTFLMLPSDQFLAGLVSFLLTHLCYIVAFAGLTASPYWSPAVPLLLLYGIGSYALLHNYVGSMRIPVLLYMTAILVMAWLALAMAWQQPGLWATYAAWGSILFVISDSVLAFNRFRRPVAGGQLIVLSTYYLAQWLIASSLYG